MIKPASREFFCEVNNMDDLNLMVGMGGVILGFVLNYLNYQRNKDKDLKKDTKEDAELKYKLDYIGKGVDDIRLDMKTINREVDELKIRLARVEESTKSAHHRIAEFVQKGVE
jgi:peptidoglycan hydrolase CwlO-like protein